MNIVFDFFPEKCSACGACAVACMDQRDVDIASGQSPMRRVLTKEEAGKTQYLSLSCLHCADAPCVSACPSHCLFKDEGLTLYDNTQCIGCRRCYAVCPHDAPTFRADGKMEKCDGCIQRIKSGLEPACTRVCPTGALLFRLI